MNSGGDNATLEEMVRRIEVADVVALDLEARAVVRARGQDVLDILERVAKDPRVEVWYSRSRRTNDLKRFNIG
jgi:hypothetical protein